MDNEGNWHVACIDNLGSVKTFNAIFSSEEFHCLVDLLLSTNGENMHSENETKLYKAIVAKLKDCPNECRPIP